MNIEGTYLGEGGISRDNTSVSSTFCAYAYALGGPPMTVYSYGHNETVDAAWAMWNSVYNSCRAGWPWYYFIFGCPSSAGCNNAAAMVLNCLATPAPGSLDPTSYCGQNNNQWWQATLTQPTSHAETISPDRLGGLTRFLGEIPRPTTWATDTVHWLRWNAAGRVCGCFE